MEFLQLLDNQGGLEKQNVHFRSSLYKFLVDVYQFEASKLHYLESPRVVWRLGPAL